MTSARRTALLAGLFLLPLQAAQAAVPPTLAPGGQLSDVRSVCGDEIRASRKLGNKDDADFDADLAQLHDSLRTPPKPGRNGKGTGIHAEPKSFSRDEDGRASHLLVSCLIYPGDSKRIGTDLRRIARTWPDIRSELVRGFGPVATVPAPEPGALRCERAYAAQEAEFADIDRRNPARQPDAHPEAQPILPGLQVALYMTSQRLLLLDTQCKDQARYAEYPAVKKQFDAAVRACAAFTGNTHDCQARLAW